MWFSNIKVFWEWITEDKSKRSLMPKKLETETPINLLWKARSWYRFFRRMSKTSSQVKSRRQSATAPPRARKKLHSGSVYLEMSFYTAVCL